MITQREKDLWSLLDDIDTALDLFKPELNAFEKYVCAKVEERNGILENDGHGNFRLPTPPKQDKESE